MISNLAIPKQNQLFDSAQSRELDHKTITEFGIDGFTLMEIAASGAASQIENIEGRNKSGLFLCGKGNNAGDAIAVARYLVNDANHTVNIFMIFGDEHLSADAEKNLHLLRKLKNAGNSIHFISDLEEITTKDIHYIVDGIFGTGLSSKLRDPLPGIINQVNAWNKPIYSMDVPSGLNADSGKIQGASIRANYTFTFGTNKQGFYLNDGPDNTGKVSVIRLPFPNVIANPDTFLIDSNLAETLPQIQRQAKHKYDNGVVHILAGSEGLTGAAIMSAQSAWKQGAGAVILYTPKKLLPIYESALPQIIKVAVGTDDDEYLKIEHSDTILKSLEKKPGFLLAGPGIGTHKSTQECLYNILTKFKRNVLIDADALSIWDQLQKVSPEQKEKWILTPHIGEAINYLGAKFYDDSDRLEWAKAFSENHKCSVLLKGNPTFFASGKGQIYITGYDTSVFSRAGFGDVLSGAAAAIAGITSNITIAVITTLWYGYRAYLVHDKQASFAPEHLL